MCVYMYIYIYVYVYTCNTLQTIHRNAIHCNTLPENESWPTQKRAPTEGENQKSVLQCATTHCITHCNTLQHAAAHCSTLHHTITHIASHCITLQHTASHCNTLQYTETHRNTEKHISTHFNTLKRDFIKARQSHGLPRQFPSPNSTNHVKEPYISAKEPYISAQWPCVSVKEPCISQKSMAFLKRAHEKGCHGLPR